MSESTTKKCMRKINLFPNFIEKEDDDSTVFGCKQTTVFGTTTLALLVSLTVYYALRKIPQAQTISGPSIQEVTDLFSSGSQPYCECDTIQVQYKEIAKIAFVYDTLCEEVPQVWNNIKNFDARRFYQATFKQVIKGLFEVCSVTQTIARGVISAWEQEYFTTQAIYSRQQLRQALGPVDKDLRNRTASQISAIFRMGLSQSSLNAPAAYTTDSQVVPPLYEDSWASHPFIQNFTNGSTFSLSTIAQQFKNRQLNARLCGGTRNFYKQENVTDFDLQCYFHEWSSSSCPETFEKLVDIVKNNRLFGMPASSGNNYTFDLTYYCSVSTTLWNFPAEGLASTDWWAWSQMGGAAFPGVPASRQAMALSNFETVRQAIDSAFLISSSINITYKDYFNNCQPKRCSYTEEVGLDTAAIVLVLFGLLGGFVSALRLIIPILFSPCEPSKKKRESLEDNTNGDIELDGKDSGGFNSFKINRGTSRKETIAGSEVKQLRAEVRELRALVMQSKAFLMPAPNSRKSNAF